MGLLHLLVESKEGLIQRQPNHYHLAQLRTLQRRVNEWRSEQVNQEDHSRMMIPGGAGLDKEIIL